MWACCGGMDELNKGDKGVRILIYYKQSVVEQVSVRQTNVF